jgi:hypothetical protein
LSRSTFCHLFPEIGAQSIPLLFFIGANKFNFVCDGSMRTYPIIHVGSYSGRKKLDVSKTDFNNLWLNKR